MKKSEIVLAHWTNKDKDFSWTSSDSCGSAWLSLRCVDPSDPDAYADQESRAKSDIGVYVWFSAEGTISLDLRLHGIHSMTEYECALRLKALRALRAKAFKHYPMLGNFERSSSMCVELIRLFDAMGVRNSMTYTGGGKPETFTNVNITIHQIAAPLQKKMDDMAARKGNQS